MKKGMLIILLLAVVLGAGLFAARWFGMRGEWAGDPATVLVTAYDAKGTPIATECGFFVGPRRLVVHRHICRNAERLDAKTLDGRTFSITAMLRESPNLDTILLATDAAATAAQVLKLTAKKPQLGQKLTVLLPPLKRKSTDKGRPAGAVSVSQITAAGWQANDFFFVEGDIPEEATGGPLVDEERKVVGYGTFLVADGRPIRVADESRFIVGLMQEADRNMPQEFAKWLSSVGKEVKLVNVGRVGRLASWALRNEDYLACSIEWTRLEPSNREAWTTLAQAYANMGRSSEATTAAEKALQLNEASGSPDFNLAINYEQAGRLEDAIAAYKERLRARPEDYGAYDSMGLVYLKMNRNEEALAAFKNAVTLNNNFVEARVDLACAYARLGQHQAAADELVKAVKMNPSDPRAHQNLGEAYLHLGRPEDAMKECQKAIELDPNCAAAYLDLGVACNDLGRKDEAIVHYSKAISIKPDFAIAHQNLAASYREFNRFEEAAREAREAVRLDPKYTNAYLELGWSCKALKQYDEAVSAFDKVVELAPELSYGYEGRGYTHVAQGKKALALKDYEMLKTLDPKEAELLINKINKL